MPQEETSVFFEPVSTEPSAPTESPIEAVNPAASMHKRKIDMADEIFVINVCGYIGSSTKSEIEYAEATGKLVRYLEEV